MTNTDIAVLASGTDIVLLGQTIVSAGVGGGDSGSAIFRINGTNTVDLVGLLWGGDLAGTEFVYSPLTNIEEELGPLTTF